jgi:hypothetical protein
MIFYRKSPVTGKAHSMDLNVTWKQLDAWEGGVLIQNAFPHLTPSERDFIKLGIIEKEWDTYFKQEKERE